MGNEKKQFSWITIFLIGLGFFTTGISWSLFNSYVPIFLQESIVIALPGFVFVTALAGFIMGLDNLIAIILNPIMGARSDKTWNRFGRRMPYVIVGIPVAAAFLVALPIAATVPGILGLASLVILILGFDISMAIYRAPVVAMMPDFAPPEKRSPANGVINLMGGIGSVIAFALGAVLYGISPLLAFGVTSLTMMICWGILILLVREPEIPQVVEKVAYPLRQAFREVVSDRSILSLLLAIFAWFPDFVAVINSFLKAEVSALTLLNFLISVNLRVARFEMIFIPKAVVVTSRVDIGISILPISSGGISSAI